ncbi:putative GntR family transcriptional regulator [Rhodococcus opacus B4]|uniref:Putative GntR family transcriptional regulator n=2 Tax=Rhodococcus opacus TaxID=37919 RepID=C1B7B0_RHOOB|nr:putative GntR family transcriptional regulator [Rhodococcus opacus B4]
MRSVAGRKVSAVDLVLQEIRRAILSGELAPGQPFTVPALTDRLGVSHVPVREALRTLEAQGLVSLSPSRSAVVAPLDPDDLRNIFRIRLRLEPELAALSAAKRSDSDLGELGELVQETFSAKSEDTHWELHRRFHTALISPAANEWDLRVLEPLWDAAERYIRIVFEPFEAAHVTVEQRERIHDELVTAAESRDPEQIRDELRRHLELNLATTLELMGSIVPAGTSSWLTQHEPA